MRKRPTHKAPALPQPRAPTPPPWPETPQSWPAAPSPPAPASLSCCPAKWQTRLGALLGHQLAVMLESDLQAVPGLKHHLSGSLDIRQPMNDERMPQIVVLPRKRLRALNWTTGSHGRVTGQSNDFPPPTFGLIREVCSWDNPSSSSRDTPRTQTGSAFDNAPAWRNIASSRCWALCEM